MDGANLEGAEYDAETILPNAFDPTDIRWFSDHANRYGLADGADLRGGSSNQAYAKARGGMTCPICGMAVVEGMSPELAYKGKTYYFCMTSHRDLFKSAPDKVLKMMAGGES